MVISPIWPLGENPRVGDPYIIVNKLSNKLAYIDRGEIQGVFPIATGKTKTLTPEGEFDIVAKLENPYYIKKTFQAGVLKILLVLAGLDLMQEGRMGPNMEFTERAIQIRLENIFQVAVYVCTNEI